MNLRFLKDNPRVYSCIYDELDFENLPEAVQQEKIFEKLQAEPSVKNLVQEIKRHGGLMERILVRLDTMQVVEGNSRLARISNTARENKEGGLGAYSFAILFKSSPMNNK